MQVKMINPHLVLTRLTQHQNAVQEVQYIFNMFHLFSIH